MMYSQEPSGQSFGLDSKERILPWKQKTDQDLHAFLLLLKTHQIQWNISPLALEVCSLQTIPS